MSKLNYSIIAPIKESNKGKVCLAKVEGYEFPVIVKELIHGNSTVFRSLSALDSEYVPKIYELREDTNRLLVVEEKRMLDIAGDVWKYINSKQSIDKLTPKRIQGSISMAKHRAQLALLDNLSKLTGHKR